MKRFSHKLCKMEENAGKNLLQRLFIVKRNLSKWEKQCVTPEKKKVYLINMKLILCSEEMKKNKYMFYK